MSRALLQLIIFCTLSSTPLLGQDLAAADSSELDSELANETGASTSKNESKGEPSNEVAPPGRVRRFQAVLDELLAEFGYDVKQGQFKTLKNISIRRVEVSDALPDTYRDYVKLLVSERIRDNSNVPLIHCIPCSSRTSKLVEGKIVITSPVTDANELKTAGERLGIENYMDVVLVYHTTHMVLAFDIFRTGTNELVWARTYNSETVKSRYQKLSIDYTQVAKSRESDEYKPDYRLMIGIGGANIPNLSGVMNDNFMLTTHFRATERFDNRHTEFGLLLAVQLTLSKLLKEYPTVGTVSATTPTEDTTVRAAPFRFSLGLYGLYAHNFLGEVESYDTIRHALTIGAGALLAQSYIAPSLRLGWDFHFGRRFVFSLAGVYVAPAKILINNEFIDTNGGMGGDAVISLNF